MSDPTRDEPVIEKRFIVAIGLSVLILIVWQFLFPTAPPPTPPAPEPAPVVEGRAEPSSETEPADRVPPADASAPPQAEVGPTETVEAKVASTAEEITVNVDPFDVVLTNEGGRVRSWALRNYRSAAGDPVELVPIAARQAGRLPFALDFDDPSLAERLNTALFTVDREPVEASGDGDSGERIRFSWSDGAGLTAEKSLTFRSGSPLVDVRVEVRDRGRPLAARVTWGPGLEADDAIGNGGYMHYTGQAVVQLPGDLPWRKGREKLDEDYVVPASARPRWAGLEEQYFAALVVPTGPPGAVVVRHEMIASAPAGGGAAEPVPQLMVAVELPEGSAKLFVGPKEYRMLRGLGLGLENVVFFSSYALIYWIARWLFLALTWIHDHTVANYGLAIILSTIALRLILFPLNQYSMVRMKKVSLQMQRIQPKVKAIQQKYKKSKDPQARLKMNEATMALYREEGVNPLGGMSGCLPMLAQFPILIAFYNVLTVAVELRGAPFFGWIHDLTLKDPLYVTPLLMGATMFLQQKMTPTTGIDPAQQRMMMIMPVVFTVMFINLPSGLVLYWLVNNVLGIGQQWLVNRHIARLQAEGRVG